MQCIAAQFPSLQCSAVQCSAVQCSAVQCSAVQCSAVQCSAVQCSAVQCSAVEFSAAPVDGPHESDHGKDGGDAQPHPGGGRASVQVETHLGGEREGHGALLVGLLMCVSVACVSEMCTDLCSGLSLTFGPLKCGIDINVTKHVSLIGMTVMIYGRIHRGREIITIELGFFCVFLL